MSDAIQTVTHPTKPQVEIVTQREFRGHTISLNEDLCFEISGPLYKNARPRDCLFQALADAKKDIATRAEEQIREDASNVKLQLKVYVSDGSPEMITKILRSSGDIDVKSDKHVYPRVDWIRDALRRRDVLRTELNELSEKLRGFEITVSRQYGRIALEDLPRVGNSLIAEYNSKLELAEKIEQDIRAAAEAAPVNDF